MNGCKPEAIKTYKVAKVKAQPIAQKAPSSAPFKFTTPSGWQEQPGSGMRLASFSINGGGDVSVVTLPGMGGDLKSNVNRWRGQVGLGPLEDLQAINNSVKAIKIDGQNAVGLELYAPGDKPDKAMRVALLEKDGVNWFFKLAGPAKLVRSQQKAFDAFIASVDFTAEGMAQAAQTGQTDAGGPATQMPMAQSDQGTSADQGTNPHGDMSTGGSDMNAGALPPVAQTQTTLDYKLPAGWKEKPASSMRVASFEAGTGDQASDVSVVALAGDGGGLLENTNRWRQQLEMAPTDQAGLKNSVKDITVDGNKGYFMALYTSLEGKGMLVALVEQGGQTWFIKLTGPAKAVQSQEQAFQNFVQSITFHAKGSRT